MNDANNTNPEKHSSKQSPMDKLIHLKDKAVVSNSSDLNSRLNEIETELKHLNARESATNKSFRELLSETKKIAAGQTAELTEAKQKVTDISEKYKKMTQDYQRIAASTNILSANLENTQKTLSADIDTLRNDSDKRSEELAEGQLQLIERAKRIEDRAQQMAEDLDYRVDVIRTTIKAVESKLSEEIREVAAQSEQRDEALGIRADKIEEELGSAVAGLKKADADIHAKFDEQVRQLRAADTNLSDRAAVAELEISGLQGQAEDLQFQSNILDTRATSLEERSNVSEQTLDQQAALLASASDRIGKHYKGFALAIVLIAASIGVMSYLNQGQFSEIAQKDSNIENQLVSQQTAISKNETEIASLQQQNLAETDEQIKASIQQQNEQLVQLENEIRSLGEKADNTAQRMSAMAPHRSFGLDNTIHNASWLAAQDQNQYVVEVMTVTDKQSLYQVATRWSNLMNRANLSFIEKQQNESTLYTLYYGPFESKAAADQISRRLPVMNYSQPPMARQISEIQ